MAKQIVTGGEYFELDGQLAEIKRQLRQPNGYPFGIQDLRKALQNIIEGRFSITRDGSQFPTWKTISIGTHKTVDELKTAVKAVGHKISDWANDILGKPAFAIGKDKSKLELVKLSVAELGFKNGATCKDIYARAIELGLALCPNEVGPQLRLQYTDQPKGEWILVAMEPISASDGDPRVFGVERDGGGGSWLDASYDCPDRVYDSDDVWVFARRK